MIAYRDATPEDGGLLAGIASATFLETFGHLYKMPDLEAFISGFTAQAYAAELAQPDVQVRFACVGAAPIGFAKISAITLPVEPEGPAIELRQLYLFKPWHGQGIAEQLMAWAFEQGTRRGATEIWLSVFTENHRARRFYGRHGFAEIRPYAFMVGSQADEDILCRKRLA